MVAMESSLVKGMVEQLPAPGSVFSQEKRGAWLDLMGRLLDLVYTDGPVSVAEPSGKVTELVPEVMEGRVMTRALPAPTDFGDRLQKKKGPKPRVLRPASPGLAAGRKPGVLVGIVKEALAATGAPMSVKSITHWAKKKRAADVAKYPNLHGNVYQAVIGMVKRRELDDDVEDGVTVYFLKTEG